MLAAWGLAIVSLFVLTACTAGSTASNQPAAGGIPRGGTLRVVEVESGATPNTLPDATELDPALGPYQVLEYLRCCVGRTLLSYNGRPTAKGGADLHPGLAAAAPKVSSDGLTWTFRIRRALDRIAVKH